MKNLMLVAAAVLALSPAAFAKGKGKANAQNHHCEVGGATVTKTHKECTKAGGTWAKGAPAADATTPAPATK